MSVQSSTVRISSSNPPDKSPNSYEWVRQRQPPENGKAVVLYFRREKQSSTFGQLIAKLIKGEIDARTAIFSWRPLGDLIQRIKPAHETIARDMDGVKFPDFERQSQKKPDPQEYAHEVLDNIASKKVTVIASPKANVEITDSPLNERPRESQPDRLSRSDNSSKIRAKSSGSDKYKIQRDFRKSVFTEQEFVEAWNCFLGDKSNKFSIKNNTEYAVKQYETMLMAVDFISKNRPEHGRVLRSHLLVMGKRIHDVLEKTDSFSNCLNEELGSSRKSTDSPCTWPGDERFTACATALLRLAAGVLQVAQNEDWYVRAEQLLDNSKELLNFLDEKKPLHQEFSALIDTAQQSFDYAKANRDRDLDAPINGLLAQIK